MHSTSPLSYFHEASKSGTRFVLELAADYLEIDELAELALTLYQLSAGRDEENDAPPELDHKLALDLIGVLGERGIDDELIAKALNVNLDLMRKETG